MKRIVIVGGGFAGLNLARNLDTKQFEVLVADRNNYHFFPPLLYQVSTALVSPSNIAYPYRRLFRKKNIRFRMGELQSIDTGMRTIQLGSEILAYDYLVLANGASTNFFGMPDVARYALPMKNVQDALRLRNHLLLQMEMAAAATNPAEQQKHLTVVVAGAGPTGVELAGMLSDLRRDILKRDYPELSETAALGGIHLLDGVDAVVKSMSRKSQTDTQQALHKMGVRVSLNAQVSSYNGEVVTLGNGELIPAKTLVWAAGITGTVFPGLPIECYGRGRRLQTDAYNRVTGTGEIFAIGDNSVQVTDPQFPNGHPQLAQVAIQQGKNLARNLNVMSKGGKQLPFRYIDKGNMAIIGRHKAVADLPHAHLKGFIAWAMWLFVHLISLVSHRNRITTLYNWMIAYLTRDQALRMIVRPAADRDEDAAA